ncbi:hypothetical protein [uncultured Capnocytophaga sp.]|uniref:hypothetical protein n=1 Tax=uncultured Capnocytophaga sp. TaxID=159273 RepID=UPI0025965C7C|nr:hypothetical protein [uncultured Capnocytophaga sp.]
METKELNSYFGNTLKSQLPKDFVQLIDKVEQLTPEEREILQTAMIRSSEKHLGKISKYISFFFWFTIIGVVCAIILFLQNTK